MRDRHLWKFRAQVPQATAGRVPGGGLWYSEKDIERVDHLWTRWQLDRGSRVVVMCPGARSHIKRWSGEGFATVADRLVTDAGVDVIMCGEPDEAPVIDEILAMMRQPAHRAVGLTTIRQLGVLIRRVQLVISNDSASLHVASAVDTPTVAIFGPTDEEKYGPSALQQRVVRRRLFCTPCETALCRFSHECMRFISAEEVYDAAIELLGCKRQDAGCRMQDAGQKAPRDTEHGAKKSKQRQKKKT